MVLQIPSKVYPKYDKYEQRSAGPSPSIPTRKPNPMPASQPPQNTPRSVCEIAPTYCYFLSSRSPQSTPLVRQNRSRQLCGRHPNLVLLRRRIIRYDDLAVVVRFVPRRRHRVFGVLVLDQLGRRTGQQTVDETLHFRAGGPVPVAGALLPVPNRDHGLHVLGGGEVRGDAGERFEGARRGINIVDVLLDLSFRQVHRGLLVLRGGELERGAALAS